MADARAPVLIPYARLLECRERRLGMAAGLTRQDGPCPVDTEVLPAAVANDERTRDASRVLETDSGAGVYKS